jgi:hypothetical protein
LYIVPFIPVKIGARIEFRTPTVNILFCVSTTAVFIKRRVAGVEILAIELIGYKA